MHRSRRAFAAVASVAMALSTGIAVAHAAASSILYVNDNTSSNCTDTGSGAGSSATPFCTVQAAANAAGAGDTVDIYAGIYNGAVNVTTSGTAAAPITFQPVGSGVTTISDGTGQTGPALTFTGSSYVDFNGDVPLADQPYHAPGLFVASALVNGSSHITLDGIDASSTGAAYSVQVAGSSSDVTLSHSILNGPHSGVLVQAGSSGDVISTNEISSQASGIVVDGASNTAITSNTLQGQSTSDYQIEVGAGATGTSIEDNIATEPAIVVDTGAAISVDSTSAAGTTEDYNVVWPVDEGMYVGLVPAYSWAGKNYASQATFNAATGQGKNDVVADPQLWLNEPYSSYPTAPQMSSANSAAPGFLTADVYGMTCESDPEVVGTGVGPDAACERGAVQEQFSPTLLPSVAPVTALGVAVTNSIGGEVHAGGTWFPAAPSAVPAATYVLSWSDSTPSTSTPGSPSHVETTTTHTFPKVGVYTISDVARLPGGISLGTQNLGFDTAGSGYTAYGPTRILDTRNGTGAAKAKVSTGSSVTVLVAGRNLIPTNVSAVALNLTVTNATGNGFLSAYADADGGNSTSNLNYLRGQTVANSVIVPVAPDGKITIANTGPAGSADLIADVSGYFTPAAGDGYAATPLTRILDTRTGTGAPAAKVAANSGVAVAIAGAGPTPAGTAAVAVHVTVVDTTGNGWIAAQPDGAGVPGTSILNYGKGQIVSNTVIVPVGADGKIELYNGGGSASVDLIADVSGYFSASATEAYMPIVPYRDYDSRIDGFALGVNGTQSYSLYSPKYSPYIMPPGADVITNITLTDETSNGFITAYPSGTTPPSTSNLNYAPHQNIGGLSILSATDVDNSINVHNQSTGTSDIILDVLGYFANS